MLSDDTDQIAIDVTQLTRTIREQIQRMANFSIAPEDNEPLRVPDTEAAIERLQSIARELESLQLRLEVGEPPDSTGSLRRQIGRWVKHRLYRLLWWQTYQLKALSGLMLRQVQEILPVINELVDLAKRQEGELRRVKESLRECRRRIQDQEIRLQQLESAQLRLQAAKVEWNTKSAVDRELAVESLRQEVREEIRRLVEPARLHQQG